MVAVPQLAFGPDEALLLPIAGASVASGGGILPHPGFRFRATLAASGAVSLTLHAAAAAVLFMTWQRNELGVLKEPTDAINVEFIASPTLERALVDVKETQTGSASSVAQEVGADTDSEAQSVAETKPEESADPVPVAEPLPAPAPPAVANVVEPTETVIAGASQAEDSVPPPAALPKTAEQSPRRTDRQVDKPKKRVEKAVEANTAKKSDEADARAKKKGGAASRASAASAPGSSRASASSGDIAGYAARVRARVAGNKPAGGGLKGTPTVSFGVSQSGGLSFVRLKRSSGVSALDQAALSAVRRSAPFPAPPPGVSASKLSFSMPMYFR
jgi:protein TonB